jgi:RNA-dependent RNA polymerase
MFYGMCILQSLTDNLKSPWKELDLEEEMLLEDPYAGLGFSSKKPDWYGGKVIFRAILRENKATKITPYPYTFTLERAELGPSCRFTQRFGSKRFIRVSISKSIFNKKDNKIIEFFKHPFVLNGRVFRAFFAKEHNAFLVETNEVTDGSKVSESPLPPSEHGPLPFLDFLRWHNPIKLNAMQVSIEVKMMTADFLTSISKTMAKYAARFALGLSNSVPGLKLEPAQILSEPEISTYITAFVAQCIKSPCL